MDLREWGDELFRWCGDNGFVKGWPIPAGESSASVTLYCFATFLRQHQFKRDGANSGNSGNGSSVRRDTNGGTPRGWYRSDHGYRRVELISIRMRLRVIGYSFTYDCCSGKPVLDHQPSKGEQHGSLRRVLSAGSRRIARQHQHVVGDRGFGQWLYAKVAASARTFGPAIPH